MDHHKEHEGYKENTFEALSHTVTGRMILNTPKLKEGIKRYIFNSFYYFVLFVVKKTESNRNEPNRIDEGSSVLGPFLLEFTLL